jgi:NADH-quinone oxidoreductase subunit C
MSDAPATTADVTEAAAPAPTTPGRLDADAMLAIIAEKFGVARDASDQWDLSLVLPVEQLRDCVQFIRDDSRLSMDMLIDIAGVDYLSYPDHRGERFAVIYLFKSLRFNHRLRLKVMVDEDDAKVPSIHDLYKIADWSEREAWDQVGIVFTGHPNLKRLLNHHEFVGHPLRKDYPVQKRQKLSVNDPMLDQLVLRLRQNGYTVLDEGGSA